MISAISSLPGFDEFAAAATIEAPAVRDRLDDIGDWVRISTEEIAKVRAAMVRIQDVGRESIDVSSMEYLFTRSCDADAMAKDVWERAVRLVANEFVAPTHVDVGDTDAFVREACGIDSERGSRDHNEMLAAFSPRKIRGHFGKLFGDTREVAIRQLREKVLRDIGSHRRPGAPFTLWCSIHDRCYSRGEYMRDSYSGGNFERFSNALRYIIHLATGTHPSEVRAPSFFGFNDGANEWERRMLFRVQKNPFPGARSLRFTADRHVVIDLEPSVLSRIQAQWDEQF